MRVNWFCPLSPSKTAIADYSQHVLEALSQQAEVVVWTDQATWDPRIEQYAEVRRLGVEPPWKQLNQANATFYNIGNNPEFHGRIWRISQQLPGIVILHDTRLQHLFAALFMHEWKDIEGYRSAMSRYYGSRGQAATEAFLSGELPIEKLSELCPLTPLACENALGTVVHVPDEFEILARTERRPTLFTPLPYSISTSANDPAPVRQCKSSGLPLRLMVFGFLGSPNRRLDPFLQALAALPQRDALRLHIYGRLPDTHQWIRRIRQLGLTDIVRIHGYVTEQQLDEALAASHLAINLRYPSMGEASWSQLRLWRHRLPSLVTRTGWYASIPETAASFVRPDREIDDIQRHLSEFISDPDSFARQGEQGYQLLQEHHAPADYADRLLAFALRARQSVGRLVAGQLTRRAAQELGPWLEGANPTPLLTQIGRSIQRFAA